MCASLSCTLSSFHFIEYKMTRQIDVKALISHLVRSDGADKCRICMGDTSEGQVYLGDTVMMDGDRSVTLSELLEVITGVEVQMDEDLPGGLCPTCYESAVAAAAFRDFCHQTLKHWHQAVKHLESLHTCCDFEGKKSLYTIITMQDNKLQLDGIAVEDHNYKDEYFSNGSDELGIVPSKRLVKIKTENKTCKCSDCNKCFVSPKALFDHLKDSTDNKLPCYVCALIMTREDLVIHLKNKHSSDLYCCKKCPALSRSKKQLRRHLVEAHSSGSHFCGECGRSFKNQYALHGHSSLHLTKNCPGCDKLFRNRKCYTSHVTECCNLDLGREDTYRTKTKILFEVENVTDDKKLKVGVRGSADKQCICDYCGKTYAGKKFVSAHIQIVHMKNTHRPCPYCGKSYAAAHMTEHIKRHEKVESFTCEHCGNILKTRLGYIQHRRLHTGEKPYKCKYCPASFSASSRRSQHITDNHKTPDQIIYKYSCDFCPAKFRLPYKLKQHIDDVHCKKKDNSKEFECPECLIKFSTCRGLLYHSRKHETFKLKSTKKEKPLPEYSLAENNTIHT